MNYRIDKEAFKKDVVYNVKSLYRKTIDEATPQQVYQAVSLAVKDMIIDTPCRYGDLRQEHHR